MARDSYTHIDTRVSIEVIVTIASKLGYNLFMGLTTYLYRGEIIQLLSTSRTSQ